MREAPLNILIIDDDPALVRAARALLSRRDCHIEAVFSALDGLARVRAGGIDGVLLDVWMPEVDGLSALEELCRLPSPPRVVLMSGHIDAKVEAAVQAGKALACLAKPIDFDLALTLLAGEAPDRPLQVHPDLDRSALAAFASSALSRGIGFIEGAPQLPASTPVSLTFGQPPGELTLLAVADPSIRIAGKRGLALRLAGLTDAQKQALRSLGGPVAEPQPAAGPEIDRAQELYLRGLEKLETGKYERALLDLRQARELKPDDQLIKTAELRATELAGVDKARGLFRTAEPLAESQPHEALKLVEDAIRLDPNRALYHREAARLYLRLGENMELAEERLGAAIHLAPSDPAPRLHLAQLLERAGRVKEALWACEAAQVLFPGDPELGKLASRLRRKSQPPPT